MKLKNLMIFFSLLFFAAVGVLTYSLQTYLDRHDEITDWVTHTDEVIIQASDLLKSVLDLETGLRGYLITGNDEFLEPYDKALKKWDRNFENLKTLVSDNPSQVKILIDINKILEVWESNVAQRLIRLRRKNLSKAITLVSKKEGKEKIDKIRGKFKDFINNELSLKKSQLTKLKKSYRTLTSFITIGGLTLFLLFLFKNLYLVMSLDSGFRTISKNFAKVELGQKPFIDYLKRKDEFRELFISFNKMVSENEKYKEEQINSEKFASIGRIAAGVGHEINNPLAIILGYTRQMKNFYDKDSEQLNRICFIETAAFRIRDIVQGLKTFVRKDTVDKDYFSLNKAIQNTVSLFQEIFRTEGIRIEFKNSSEELMVWGSFGRFQQVLMNLFQNAKDSLEYSLEKNVIICLEKADQVAIVTVSDTGEGIKEENLDKVFEPFFTTKEVGKGSGMGLSLVKEFLREMNSEIQVISQYNKGTTFKIIFPLEGVSPNNPVEAKASQTHEKFHFEDAIEKKISVLIVDDEPDLRKIFSDEIKGLGFKVETAASGIEALEMIEKNNFDLILTDYKMPQMDGLALIKEIRLLEEKRHLKIILMSGAIDVERVKLEDITAVIKKPVDFEKLGALLHTFLT